MSEELNRRRMCFEVNRLILFSVRLIAFITQGIMAKVYRFLGFVCVWVGMVAVVRVNAESVRKIPAPLKTLLSDKYVYSIEQVLSSIYKTQVRIKDDIIIRETERYQEEEKSCWQSLPGILSKTRRVLKQSSFGPIKNLVPIAQEEWRRIARLGHLLKKIRDDQTTDTERETLYSEYNEIAEIRKSYDKDRILHKAYLKNKCPTITCSPSHCPVDKCAFLYSDFRRLRTMMEAYHIGKREGLDCLTSAKSLWERKKFKERIFTTLRTKQEKAAIDDNFEMIKEKLKFKPNNASNFAFDNKIANKLIWLPTGDKYQLWYRHFYTFYNCNDADVILNKWCQNIHKNNVNALVWKSSDGKAVVLVDKKGKGHRKDLITLSKFIVQMQYGLREEEQRKTYNKLVAEKAIISEFMPHNVLKQARKDDLVNEGKVTNKVTQLFHSLKFLMQSFMNWIKRRTKAPPKNLICSLPSKKTFLLNAKLRGKNTFAVGTGMKQSNYGALLQVSEKIKMKKVTQEFVLKVLNKWKQHAAGKCNGMTFAKVTSGVKIDKNAKADWKCPTSVNLCDCLVYVGDTGTTVKFTLGDDSITFRSFNKRVIYTENIKELGRRRRRLMQVGGSANNC
jgi:hypothetical protein